MTTPARKPKPLLQTRNLKAGYLGRPVVDRIDIHVDPGEVVCLLGPNGAGKTTTLLTVAGELEPVDGLVMFSNVPTWTPMHTRVRAGGIGLVTEERLVFTKLSARDNLRVGGGSVEVALELFPELEPRLSVPGGMLSGGEQQMLALARALSRNPRLLLADELSLGLAPLIVDRLLGAVRTAADERGTGALIVEQHARKALRYADRVYLMARGQVRLELPAAEAIERLDEIEDAYLSGTSDTEDDHIERQRRKTKRKAWRRQRVRDRELERLSGKLASTRSADQDDYYFDLERHRRDVGERLRGGRKMTTRSVARWLSGTGGLGTEASSETDADRGTDTGNGTRGT
ncbi:MAG: ATP-binding cassette domain-containing protein [Actinomycetota bacterium]